MADTEMKAFEQFLKSRSRAKHDEDGPYLVTLRFVEETRSPSSQR